MCWRSSIPALVGVLLVAASGCGKSITVSPPGDSSPALSRGGTRSAAAAASAGTPPASSASQQTPSTGSWVQAVRTERWGDAARLLDALDKKQRDSPGLRYVRARAAIARGEHARAKALLDGLERSLPMLAADIARYRAEAQHQAGPYASAAKYFEAQKTAPSLSRAAVAYERAGKLKLARRAADRAILLASRHQRPTEEQAEARAVRARIAEQQKQRLQAVAEWRWLAMNVPTSAHGADAAERIERLDKSRALTKSERYQRAMSMARQGLVAATERELGRIDQARGQPVPKADILHARGWALYLSRQDYAQAATLLAQAASLSNHHAVRDRFYSARALSRAHSDEQAIKLYAQLAQRFTRTQYAEQARHLSARLHLLLGNWQEAAAGYGVYLKRYGRRGRYAKSAEYERGVAWLAGKEWSRAARVFAALVKQERQRSLLASYRHLHGVALAGTDRKAAARIFRRVIQEHPLSFPALLSAARLSQLSEPLPPPIEPAAPLASNPQPLAVQLPAKVQLLVELGLDRDAEQELLRHEAQIRASFAPRGHEALCQAYGRLSTAARRYRAGRAAVNAAGLRWAPTSATRWLWSCLYPRPYQSLVRSAARRNQLPEPFIYAVMRQESGFRPAVVSPADAVGLMQLISPTAKRVAAELSLDYSPALLVSPPYNIQMGTHYLAKVLSVFGGNLALAAAAYNAGPAAVSRWLQSGEKLPLDLFVARIPYRETRHYVGYVLGNMAHYAYISGGADQVPQLSLELPQGLRASPDAY